MGSRSIAKIKASERQAASDKPATLATANAHANQRDQGKPSSACWGSRLRGLPPPPLPPPPPPRPVPPPPPLLPPPRPVPPSTSPPPPPTSPLVPASICPDAPLALLPARLTARACCVASRRLKRGSRFAFDVGLERSIASSGGGSLGLAMLAMSQNGAIMACFAADAPPMGRRKYGMIGPHRLSSMFFA